MKNFVIHIFEYLLFFFVVPSIGQSLPFDIPDNCKNCTKMLEKNLWNFGKKILTAKLPISVKKEYPCQTCTVESVGEVSLAGPACTTEMDDNTEYAELIPLKYNNVGVSCTCSFSLDRQVFSKEIFTLLKPADHWGKCAKIMDAEFFQVDPDKVDSCAHKGGVTHRVHGTVDLVLDQVILTNNFTITEDIDFILKRVSLIDAGKEKSVKINGNDEFVAAAKCLLKTQVFHAMVAVYMNEPLVCNYQEMMHLGGGDFTGLFLCDELELD